ncbi:GFA family protein [Tahibacter soli]|uniref:CENP-V/GFA domain-containing protein n=1 Tax=Tahibacter soli TaxID=2983605 RepID=A0A9X4BJN4_9GAMM|nr:hypothetical protein [Tahibacter soli]MDC8014863.1 hypothetical protein [Tahibacter soli]
MQIRGACHCGNIAFKLEWMPDPTEIAARACTCSFCTKHGGVWTSNPAGNLVVTIADPARVSRYAFGTKTADFHTCTACGVVPVVTSTIDGRLYAVVNVNAFENVDAAMIRVAPVTHDDADEAARLARRKRNWIADVSVAES